MSSSANIAAASASSLTSSSSSMNRKRPHHFHDGPDESAKEQRQESNSDEEERSATVESPPANRLYRHALESIFTFLSLKELHAVLAVSHSWSSAVDSMRSIDAAVEELPPGHLLRVCSSRLTRHIGELGSNDQEMPISGDNLLLVGLCMNGLQFLHCKLTSPIKLPLIFPPSLTELNVELADSAVDEINLAIQAVSHIPRLTRLELSFEELDPLVSFAPLRHATQLTELRISAGGSLNLKQANELRAIPQLNWLNKSLDAADLRMLLQSPHELKWRRLHTFAHLDDESVGLVAALPSLTELKQFYGEDAIFLRSLPNLRSLELGSFAYYQLISPEQMIEGVGQCIHLTCLKLSCSNLTSAHMHALLSCMPSLRELSLNDLSELESLNFLSAVTSLAHSLTNLELQRCRQSQLRVKELSHILSLKQLTHLKIVNCFSERLDSFTVNLLTHLPCTLLPNLIQAQVSCTDP